MAETQVKISELPAAILPLDLTELVAVVKGGATEQVPVSALINPTPAIADSVAVDVPGLVVDFNALLQALRDIGIVGV